MHGRKLLPLLSLLAGATLAGWLADRLGLPGALVLPLLALLLLVPLLRQYPRRSVAAPATASTGPVAEDERIALAALDDPALVVSAGWQVLAANAAVDTLFSRCLCNTDLRQTVRLPQVLDPVGAAFAGQPQPAAEIAVPGVVGGPFRLRVVRLAPDRAFVHFVDVGELRAVERMRSDFVANASHELRTPLATIAGFIETLQGPAADDSEVRQRFLAIMACEAARMRRLIDDLLSLGRIEMDRHRRPTTVIELSPLLDEVVTALAVPFAADGRELRVEAEAGLPSILADRDQMLQVLHNLLANARAYGRPGTPIRIVAAAGPLLRGGATVRLAVQDQGDGIAAEHLPRLAERFYRVDSGRSRGSGGTGLGLAIVKHIVERHRGRMDIDSRPGEGTTVTLLLPAAPS